MLFSFASQFECEAHHPIHASAREDGLLNGHLVFGAFIQAAADAGIFALIVFANDGEINLAWFPILERRFYAFEKPHRTKIGVLPERAANRNQQSPKRNVIGNARVTNGAQENCVKGPQLLQTVIRHHFPGLYVSFAAPVKFLPLPLETEALFCCFEHADAFWHHFLADTVSGDDRDVEGFHFSVYPVTDDNSGDKAAMSGAASSVFTKVIIFSVLA